MGKASDDLVSWVLVYEAVAPGGVDNDIDWGGITAMLIGVKYAKGRSCRRRVAHSTQRADVSRLWRLKTVATQECILFRKRDDKYGTLYVYFSLVPIGITCWSRSKLRRIVKRTDAIFTIVKGFVLSHSTTAIDIKLTTRYLHCRYLFHKFN